MTLTGVSAAGVSVLFFALTSQGSEELSRYVNWANILALTISAVGVVIVVLEKLGNWGRGKTVDQISAIAESVATIALRQETDNLAHLLATDELDARSAKFRLSITERTGRNRNKSRKTTKSLPAEKIADFYFTQTDGKMAILGDAGAGKTVLATTLLTRILASRTSENRHRDPVPVMFPAASWDVESSLEQWLSGQLTLRFRLSQQDASELIENGWIIPFIDGLDELDPGDSDTSKAARAIDHINRYTATTPRCNIVVTMRSGGDYERLTNRLRNIRVTKIERLTNTQIIDYLETLLQEEVHTPEWDEVFKALRSNDTKPLSNALSTVWRLNAAVVFYWADGDPSDLLPGPADMDTRDKLNHGRYETRIQRLLVKTWLVNKLVKHTRKQSSIVKRFTWLLFIATHGRGSTGNAGGREFLLHDWWRFLDATKVRRTHVFLTFTLLTFAFGTSLWFSDGYDGVNLGWYTYIAIMMNRLTIMFFSITAAGRDRMPSRVRFARLRRLPILLVLLLTTVVAGGFGAVMATTYGYIYGALIATTFVAISILLVSSSTTSSAHGEIAQDALMNDRNFTAVISVLFGTYAYMYYFPLYGDVVAIALATMVALGRMCASSYMRYIAALLYGRLHFGLPFRLRSFFSWGQEAGLLRTSGAGYQFRHDDLRRLLREWKAP